MSAQTNRCEQCRMAQLPGQAQTQLDPMGLCVNCAREFMLWVMSAPVHFCEIVGLKFTVVFEQKTPKPPSPPSSLQW